MLKTILCSLVLLIGAGIVFSDDKYFKKVDFIYQEGEDRKEADARLIVKETELLITDEDKPEKRTFARIPIESINTIVYEKSAHPRWKTAVFLTPWALFSKGKKHWLTIDFKNPDGKDDFVMLRMDKENYQMIIATLESATGKKVERIMED